MITEKTYKEKDRKKQEMNKSKKTGSNSRHTKKGSVLSTWKRQ